MKCTKYLIGLIGITALIAGCAEERMEAEPVIRPVRYQQVFATGEAGIGRFPGLLRLVKSRT